MDQQSLLKRIVKGGKRVEAVINESKQFGIKYCFHKEIITFDFYYGCWNEHGWPQHKQPAYIGYKLLHLTIGKT